MCLGRIGFSVPKKRKILRAQNSKSFEDALADVCNSIGFDMIENPNVNWERWRRTELSERIRIFITWLGDECNKNSLLILDDAEVFGAGSIQAALKLPAWHIVMSTRDSNLRWTDREFRDVRLPPLSSDDTVSILENSLSNLQPDELVLFGKQDLRSLAHVIHGHPLAAQNAVPFLLDYLITFDNPIQEFVRTIENGTMEELKVFFQFRAKDRSLWDAFNASLQQLQHEEESDKAVKLLQLLPYLRNEMVLRSEYLQLSKYLESLREVSLYITSSSRRSRSLDIHPLVLQFAQLLLSEEARKPRIKDVLQVFYESYGQQANDGQQHIVPHVKHCLSVCAQLNTLPKNLNLPDEVAAWLSRLYQASIQFDEPSSNDDRIAREIVDTSNSLTWKVQAFKALCEEAHKSIEKTDAGQAQHMIIKCVVAFKGLKAASAKEADHRRWETLPQLGDAMSSLTDMVKLTNIYPDLPLELDKFQQYCKASG
ncbi:hypothetical protein FZEAL_8146 [Fusarium zealandicum]|uniref:Uncharacterized protein n=1 Tax=Fusarium zealandicum TaxID=1053134 RepID=A0A8H4UEG3_9HYPO|nr:hypothetical protein FZEAL_8146 [Fusarium zealandicum]